VRHTLAARVVAVTAVALLVASVLFALASG
jgi:hypothetical protein